MAKQQLSTADRTITVDGTTVNFSRATSRGREICDPIELVAEKYPGYEDMAVLSWVSTEFNLPTSMRQLCESCFLRVMSNVTFNEAAEEDYITVGERTYQLHRSSSHLVLVSAPLVGVSFRVYKGELFAVAHYWQPKDECQANTTKAA